MNGKLPEKHLALLRAIEWHNNNMASAMRIAHRLKYRPARNGIFAVTSMCRAINRKFPGAKLDEFANMGLYLTRIPPKDQWGVAIWCLTHEARKLLQES